MGARVETTGTDATKSLCDVVRYRPRVEGLYARIERWTRRADGDVHWRSITKENIASVYGQSQSARIADPDDPSRVFSWLLEETRDSKGNISAYGYRAEDQKNLDPAVGFERPQPVANAYLKTIFYGNQAPDIAADWHFQVLFDYGDLDALDPINGTVGVWPGRQDPFSDFRSTFEVRTYRLCRRILMAHNFGPLDFTGPNWVVVRSTELQLGENPIATTLRAVTQKGWTQTGGIYDPLVALPAIELAYSQPAIEPQLHTVDPQSAANLPMGVDGKSYQLLDLDGEGLPGVVTQQAGALYYKRNRGNGQLGGLERIA